MHKRPRPGFYLAWIDMIYGMCAISFFLFIVTSLLINPPKTKEGIEAKAEYLITLEWPGNVTDDIDVHLLLPSGKMVNFKNREVDYALLDHDDLGFNGRYLDSAGQPVYIKQHREMISIRAVVPGVYTTNVQVYALHHAHDDSQSLPYSVKVTLLKINPYIQELGIRELLLTHVGEQRTAFSFKITPDGWATVDTDVNVPFIPTKQFAPKQGAPLIPDGHGDR